MTERKDALQALLAKVEAGGFVWNGWAESPLDRKYMGKVEDAYNGSLDSAKELHEAVLHERVLKTETWSIRYGSAVGLYFSHALIGSGDSDDNPARAWLIAILKALIATEDA